MKIIGSKIVYHNQFVDIIQDECKNGKHRATFTYLKRPSKKDRVTSVVVVPIHNGGVYLIKQYRVANRDYFWQFPGGVIETGETSTEAAAKELEEEAGLVAKVFLDLGSAVLEPGAVAQSTVYIAAKMLDTVNAHQETREDIVDIKSFSFAEIDKMIVCGQITCGFTLVGILLLKERGYWKSIRS